MMTEEESKIVKVVYHRLITSEEENWSDIDDNLEFFSLLTDKEMIQKTKKQFLSHIDKTIRCVEDHEQESCIAPWILEAAIAIVNLYDTKKNLHERNRYILSYYLVLSELKLIFVANPNSGAV